MPRKVEFFATVKQVVTQPKGENGDVHVEAKAVFAGLEITDADLGRLIGFQNDGMVKVTIEPVQMKFGDDKPTPGLKKKEPKTKKGAKEATL